LHQEFPIRRDRTRICQKAAHRRELRPDGDSNCRKAHAATAGMTSEARRETMDMETLPFELGRTA
jgi:hypothetical protein